ncbi:unnamed protein product [Sphagnum troendelagicum]|uniref:Uncharacterized protein n=1 Tax=Sphagnum troendelagicum TaxID=128251 RepID=A0ABP0TDT8_9BRYO
MRLGEDLVGTRSAVYGTPLALEEGLLRTITSHNGILWSTTCPKGGLLRNTTSHKWDLMEHTTCPNGLTPFHGELGLLGPFYDT